MVHGLMYGFLVLKVGGKRKIIVDFKLFMLIELGKPLIGIIQSIEKLLITRWRN